MPAQEILFYILRLTIRPELDNLISAKTRLSTLYLGIRKTTNIATVSRKAPRHHRVWINKQTLSQYDPMWEWHRLVTVSCIILSQDSGTNYVCCHVGTVTRWQSEPRWNRDTNPGPWDQWANKRAPVDMFGQWVAPGVEITTVCFDCYQAYDLRRRSKIWVDLTTHLHQASGSLGRYHLVIKCIHWYTT